MTTENAEKFVKRMQEDKAFAAAVEKLGSKEERGAFVKQEGYDFTMQELIDTVSKLDAVDVVGGKCCGQTCEREPGPCPTDCFKGG